MVSAWAGENGITLGQLRVDKKSNEITAIPELLKALFIKDCLVSIDAGSKRGMLVVNEAQAYIIQKIFRDYLSGVSAYLIHRSAKKMGLPLNGNEAIVRVLRNNLYAGLVRVNATEKQPERFVKGVH